MGCTYGGLRIRTWDPYCVGASSGVGQRYRGQDVLMVRPGSSLNYNFTGHGEVEGCSSMRSKIPGSLKVHRQGIMICLSQRKPPSHPALHRTRQHIIIGCPNIVTDLDIESPPKVHLIPYRLPPSTCHPWRFTATTAIPPTAGPPPRHPPPCTST